MKRNMSNTDRFIRSMIVAFILLLIATRTVEGFWAILLLAAGGILALTIAFTHCPLYRLFGYSSCPVKKDS